MQWAEFGICSEIQFQNSTNNTMEEANGDINKSSSQDIISRDTGKKELPTIILFVPDYTILLWFSTIDKESRKWYYVVLVSGSEKHHVTDASSDIKNIIRPKGKFLKIDNQGKFGFAFFNKHSSRLMSLCIWLAKLEGIQREVFRKIGLWHERVNF